MIDIQDIVASCAPWEANDQDYAEQQDYLVSLLSSRMDELESDCEVGNTSAADDDDLFEIIDGFFSDPKASQKLVELWRKFTKATSEKNNPPKKTKDMGTSLEQGFRIRKEESQHHSELEATEVETHRTAANTEKASALKSGKNKKIRLPY